MKRVRLFEIVTGNKLYNLNVNWKQNVQNIPYKNQLLAACLQNIESNTREAQIEWNFSDLAFSDQLI